MASIFTKIIQGEIPCYKIAETPNCFAFLDINPLSRGHVLVVPKNEIDNIFDLDDDLTAELNIFAKRIARAIQESVDCLRVGIAVVGLEVAHAHIHLIPINRIEDINFSREKLKLPPEEMKSIAEKIRRHLSDDIQ